MNRLQEANHETTFCRTLFRVVKAQADARTLDGLHRPVYCYPAPVLHLVRPGEVLCRQGCMGSVDVRRHQYLGDLHAPLIHHSGNSSSEWTRALRTELETPVCPADSKVECLCGKAVDGDGNDSRQYLGVSAWRDWGG